MPRFTTDHAIASRYNIIGTCRELHNCALSFRSICNLTEVHKSLKSLAGRSVWCPAWCSHYCTDCIYVCRLDGLASGSTDVLQHERYHDTLCRWVMQYIAQYIITFYYRNDENHRLVNSKIPQSGQYNYD